MQSNQDALLTPAQIDRLASFVLETHGCDMPEVSLNEAIALVLEDVAGFEVASDSIVEDYINMIRRTYYELGNH